MNYEQIEDVLQLQKQAYGCLFWIKERMRTDAALLSVPS